jgi:hypothetical protein
MGLDTPTHTVDLLLETTNENIFEDAQHEVKIVSRRSMTILACNEVRLPRGALPLPHNQPNAVAGAVKVVRSKANHGI